VTQYQFRLYVAGQNPRSRLAIQNLQHICDASLADNYTLTIVDVLQDPQAAEDAKILAAPTLILESPLPRIRIVGDLSDHKQVLFALNIETVKRDAKHD